MRVVRCRAYPAEEQIEKLRLGSALVDSLVLRLYQESIAEGSTRPLKARLKSVVGRAIGEEEFLSVSANPLNVACHRMLRWADRARAGKPRMKGIAFYGDLPRLSPRTQIVHVPLVGDFEIDSIQVEGTVRYAYFYERKGEWFVAFTMTDSRTKPGRGGFRWKASKGRMPGGVMW